MGREERAVVRASIFFLPVWGVDEIDLGASRGGARRWTPGGLSGLRLRRKGRTTSTRDHNHVSFQFDKGLWFVTSGMAEPYKTHEKALDAAALMSYSMQLSQESLTAFRWGASILEVRER